MATAWCFLSHGDLFLKGCCLEAVYFSTFGKQNEPLEVKKRGPTSLRRNWQIWRNEMLTGLCLTIVSGNSVHQAKLIGPLIEK